MKYKIYSGALQFTIFISVIIALLLAGVVMLMYTHRYFIEQSKAIIANIQFTDTGLAALMMQTSTSTDTIDLAIPDSEENQTIRIHLSNWGLFEKAYVKAHNREKYFTKLSLLGSCTEPSQRVALYLQETYKPLVVVGNTKITGNAFLPEQGIRTGNINGNSYYGSKMIYGAVKNSAAECQSYNYCCNNHYNKKFRQCKRFYFTRHINLFLLLLFYLSC